MVPERWKVYRYIMYWYTHNCNHIWFNTHNFKNSLLYNNIKDQNYINDGYLQRNNSIHLMTSYTYWKIIYKLSRSTEAKRSDTVSLCRNDGLAVTIALFGLQ